MSNFVEMTLGYSDFAPVPVKAAFERERRCRPRLSVHWLVVLFAESNTTGIETITQNVSSSGFYCLLPAPVAKSEQVMGIMKLPTHDPLGKEAVRTLECRLRLIRIDPPTDQRKMIGAAFAIEDYRVLTPYSE